MTYRQLCPHKSSCGPHAVLESEGPRFGERPKSPIRRETRQLELIIGIPKRLAETTDSVVRPEKIDTLQLEICGDGRERPLDA